MDEIKFPINQLINQEDWLEMFMPKDMFGNECLFRFQIKSFQEIDKSKLALEKLKNKMFLEQGKIILLTIDITNLSQRAKQKGTFYREIIISDSEGFSFEGSINEVLCSSEFSTDFSFKLIPKIKTETTLFFLLPNEDSDYFISIKNSKLTDTKLRLA